MGTGADFDGVDLDRLADYLGGALDGTPDEAAVARLVEADQDWSAAYVALLAADQAVQADLGTLGPAGPVPVDVADRLDHWLAGLTAVDGPAAAGPATPEPATNGPALAGQQPGLDAATPTAEPEPVPTPIPIAPRLRQRDRQRWHQQAGHRRRNYALVGLAAAAVGAVAFIGVQTTSSMQADESISGSTARTAPQAAAAAPPQLRISGTDYTAATVGDAARTPVTGGQPLQELGPSGASGAGGPTVTQAAPGTDDAKAPAGVPVELARLYSMSGRDACLTAVTRRYGGTVALVDYARFAGVPSLVLVVTGTDSPDSQRIVVVGQRCGESASVTDERYSTRVR